MNTEITGLAIGILVLAALTIVVAFRNVELHRQADRFDDRLKSIDPVIFAAICEPHQDYANGGDGKEMAASIAQAVRRHLNQP
ncbi:hypothetical protein [Glycomyces sp. NPDC021274]|uniref:hypothetical protein n=1 Tax=Glycomyces sp. NPDC021274 TaxID=3155120 RepID=UPI0033C9FBA5